MSSVTCAMEILQNKPAFIVLLKVLHRFSPKSPMDGEVDVLVLSEGCYNIVRLIDTVLKYANDSDNSLLYSQCTRAVTNLKGEKLFAQDTAKDMKMLVRYLTRIIISSPRDQLWFPALLRAAELLQVN